MPEHAMQSANSAASARSSAVLAGNFLVFGSFLAAVSVIQPIGGRIARSGGRGYRTRQRRNHFAESGFQHPPIPEGSDLGFFALKMRIPRLPDQTTHWKMNFGKFELLCIVPLDQGSGT
jgi:hypothetical protein